MELETKLKIARYYLKGRQENSYLIHRNNKVYYKYSGEYQVMNLEEFNEFFNTLAKRIYKEDLNNNLLNKLYSLDYKTAD